jgi:hypothetical protein
MKKVDHLKMRKIKLNLKEKNSKIHLENFCNNINNPFKIYSENSLNDYLYLKIQFFQLFNHSYK